MLCCLLFLIVSPLAGNYDVIQQPKNIGHEAKKHIPFFMFIDEETEMYMKNTSILGSSKKVGLWRIIVIRNLPYADSRRNGKVDCMFFMHGNCDWKDAWSAAKGWGT